MTNILYTDGCQCARAGWVSIYKVRDNPGEAIENYNIRSEHAPSCVFKIVNVRRGVRINSSTFALPVRHGPAQDSGTAGKTNFKAYNAEP